MSGKNMRRKLRRLAQNVLNNSQKWDSIKYLLSDFHCVIENTYLYKNTQCLKYTNVRINYKYDPV